MKIMSGIVLAVCLVAPALCSASDERASVQQSLDAECEAARQRKLAPERAKYVQECEQKKERSTVQDCERFYSDYGARTGDRAPLYYDLPECVAAFEYRTSYRQ